MSRLIAAPAVALLVAAGYWSVRIAQADWYARAGSPVSIRQAARLIPWNAGYHVLLADAQAGESLEAAAALNPDNAGIWIRRGLDAELHHDPRAAAFLLKAAQVSAQYEPRWTLANYYFRHHDLKAFWHWMREALAISYGDRCPIFNLCWEVTQDSARILTVLPQDTAVWRDYLTYLLGQKHFDAVPPVAARILAAAKKEDFPLLLQATDVLHASDRSYEARDIWTHIHPPTAWRTPRVSGVETVRDGSVFRAAFNGKQPESCEVLWQYVALLPGQKYDLRFEYQTEDIPPDSGLRWRILDGVGSDLSSASWKQSTVAFTATAPLARLVLAYQRVPGTTRIEGAIALRAVNVEPRP